MRTFLASEALIWHSDNIRAIYFKSLEEDSGKELHNKIALKLLKLRFFSNNNIAHFVVHPICTLV